MKVETEQDDLKIEVKIQLGVHLEKDMKERILRIAAACAVAQAMASSLEIKSLV